MAKKNSKKTVPDLRFRGFTDPWEQRQLGEVAERTGSGGTPSSSDPRYYGGSIPFLSIGDITGRFVDTTQKTLTEEGLANSTAWIVPQGAISLAMYASYGKSAILSRPMATSQAFFNVVFSSDATRDFIYSRFQCAEVRHEWDAMVSTGTQPNLSGGKLKKWEISLPPLPEQRLIGRFFKTLDSLIAAAERQEALLRQKKQAYLQLMFPCEGETQPRLRFSGFIQNWRMHRMSEMVAPLNSIQQIMPDRDIEYRLWSVPSFQLGVPENVRGSRIMSSKLVLERDDILLSKINPRIQRIWRVDSDGTLPDVGSTEWVVFRAKPSKASPLFLKALLSSPLFYRYMVSTEKGATGSQKRADKTLLMSSCYWLPSLSEQQRIGAFFHLVDATLLTVQRNLAGLKELKRAYLQRMFI